MDIGSAASDNEIAATKGGNGGGDPPRGPESWPDRSWRRVLHLGHRRSRMVATGEPDAAMAARRLDRHEARRLMPDTDSLGSCWTSRTESSLPS